MPFHHFILFIVGFIAGMVISDMHGSIFIEETYPPDQMELAIKK